MTLDWCQNFVSTQYRENCLQMDFDLILHIFDINNIYAGINQYFFYTQYLDKY